MLERLDRLYRFGLEFEPANALARQAAEAAAIGFPHGVSAFSRTTRPDAVTARCSEVEQHFQIVKTGRNPYHFTIELPREVTDEVAAIFNQLFERRRG